MFFIRFRKKNNNEIYLNGCGMFDVLCRSYNLNRPTLCSFHTALETWSRAHTIANVCDAETDGKNDSQAN